MRGRGGSICSFSVGTPQEGCAIIWVHVKPNVVSVAASLSESACQSEGVTQPAPLARDLHSARLFHVLQGF